MALTKENIINTVYEDSFLGKGESRDAVETTLELIKNNLQGGDDVLISGFGKFMIKQKNSRRGRNPQTNEDIQLAARKVVVFKTSGVLREKINNGN